MMRAACLVVVACVLAAISLGLGVRDVPLATVLEAWTAYNPQNPDHIVVRDLRLARGPGVRAPVSILPRPGLLAWVGGPKGPAHTL